MNGYLKNDKITSLVSKIGQIKHLCKKKGVASEILDQLAELSDMIVDQSLDDQNEISAQLSIYPLRQPSFSQTINEAVKVLQNYGLKLISGSKSTLIIGKEVMLWEALKEVFSVASTHGELVLIITISNACPKPDCANG